MSDVEDRLGSADPAAAMSYEHHDAGAMVSRIIAQFPRRRNGLLRSFQLKVAGGATLAAILTVGGIAALNGAAPSLAVLAIGSTGHAEAVVPTNSRYSSAMAIFARYNFSAGDTLSSSAATTPSYRLQFPSDPSSEAQRIATVFGVNGTSVDTHGDGSDWTITGSAGTAVEYENYGGVPHWSYESSTAGWLGATSVNAATQNVSHATLEADAQRYLQQLGYGFAVTDPQFSSDQGSSSFPAKIFLDAGVSYTVLVDGVATDQTVSFTVASNNQLVDASGPAFTAASATDYPLIRPTDGVTALNAQQRRDLASTGSNQSNDTTATTGPVVPTATPTTTAPATGSSGSTNATGSSGSSGSNDTTTTIVNTPPIVNVTLTDSTVSLRSYVLTNGSVWMLTVYDYSGTLANADGTNEPSEWTILAVQPAYVNVSASTEPIAY